MTSLTLRNYKTSHIYLVWIFSISCLVFAPSSSFAFTKGKVSEIVTGLTSSCDPSVCHNTDVVELITHGSLSQYDQILHILNEKGPLCLRFALEALKDKLEKQVHINCGSLVGEEKISCQNAQAEHAIINERILSLVNLILEFGS